MTAACHRFASLLMTVFLAAAAAGCRSGPASGRPAASTAGGSVAPSPAADAVVIDWRPRAQPALSAPAGAGAVPAAAAAPVAAGAVPTAGAAPAAAGAPPEPASPVPGAAAGEERVLIGRGGLWIGAEKGRRALYLFARRRRGEELALFARTFAPFRRSDGAGDLVFRGRGVTAAAAAERRMIAEWTRRVAIEAAGDGAQLPYGLAFAWHRGAAIGGVCDDLSVYLSGEVDASSCGGGETIGRLAGERLARLYSWIDGLKSFQAAGEQGLRADSLLERLIFAGQGKRQASAEEVAAIEAFAGALHHELALTAGAAPGGAKAGPSPSEAGAASEAAAGPVAPPPAPPRRAPAAAPEMPDAAGTEEAAEDAPAPPPTPSGSHEKALNAVYQPPYLTVPPQDREGMCLDVLGYCLVVETP